MGANENAVSDDAQDKISAMLVNVYGLKLPNEMFSAAALSSHELARILQEYAEALDKSKR
jgi:hypothetical protein